MLWDSCFRLCERKVRIELAFLPSMVILRIKREWVEDSLIPKTFSKCLLFSLVGLVVGLRCQWAQE